MGELERGSTAPRTLMTGKARHCYNLGDGVGNTGKRYHLSCVVQRAGEQAGRWFIHQLHSPFLPWGLRVTSTLFLRHSVLGLATSE